MTGLGLPLPSLSVYSWHDTRNGSQLSGLLRFVSAGGDIYVISATVLNTGIVSMVYARVERKDGVYSWRFRNLGGLDDVNQAQLDEDYLIGSGNFTSDIQGNFSYGWTAELVGADPAASLSPSVYSGYELLTSFTDEDFATAVATFPSQGMFEVSPPARWPGLQPAEVSLGALFER